MSKAPPDFSYIKPEHRAVDDELRNWARVVRDRPPTKVHPMFSQYRSAEHWEDTRAAIPADTIAGYRTEARVARIDPNPREALRWFYIHGGPPTKVARYIGCNVHGLAELVHQGREALK